MPELWCPGLISPEMDNMSAGEALRRHDLVWLDPAEAESLLHMAVDDQAALQKWLLSGLPVVFGRQDAAPGGLRMGFTLPGTGQRHRIEIRAPQSSILKFTSPPYLEEMVAYAPANWRARLNIINVDLRESGLIARTYGSLVTQALSGIACVRPESDLDLLIECNDRAELLTAVSILLRHDNGVPRLDGELRLPNGMAVAWRELAACVAENRTTILIKSNNGLLELTPDDYLDYPQADGAIYGKYHTIAESMSI